MDVAHIQKGDVSAAVDEEWAGRSGGDVENKRPLQGRGGMGGGFVGAGNPAIPEPGC